MDFENKVVLITGAAKGIGKTIAEKYAVANAKVIIIDLDEENGLLATRKINDTVGNAWFFKCDISIANEIEIVVNQIVGEFGIIDILINNAGISKWIDPLQLSVDDWDRVVNTNLRGTFICSREVAKIMKINGGGSIVNIASTRALMSEPNSEAYAASKGGIVSLTHALAASFAPYKIQVNCISPGWIETGDYSELKDSDHDQHFSGRVGRPEDIANACLFLTKPGNEFVSATNIIIDGGMTHKMIYNP